MISDGLQGFACQGLVIECASRKSAGVVREEALAYFGNALFEEIVP
jgi:hypothetical protein